MRLTGMLSLALAAGSLFACEHQEDFGARRDPKGGGGEQVLASDAGTERVVSCGTAAPGSMVREEFRDGPMPKTRGGELALGDYVLKATIKYRPQESEDAGLRLLMGPARAPDEISGGFHIGEKGAFTASSYALVHELADAWLAEEGFELGGILKPAVAPVRSPPLASSSASGTVTVDHATHLQFRITCPAEQEAFTQEYSATPNEIHVYEVTKNVEWVFARSR